MQIASYKDTIIYLRKLEREKLQKIFLLSQQGQLTCPCCQQPVKLKVGIHHAPIFIHPTEAFYCDETIVTLEKLENHKETNKVTVGSFSLPVKREINSNIAVIENSTVIESWKKPIQLTNTEPFMEKKRPVQVKNHYLDLDESQWAAVSQTEGPLLVLAGAGSGKTRVLTTRTAHMIVEKSIPANRLMLVTFTAKAAKEMKARMSSFPRLSTQQLHSLLVGTFHSIFFKMLAHHKPSEWLLDQLLKFDWQREQIIKEAAREIGIDEKEFAFDQALSQISYWKNNLLIPKKVLPKNDWEENVKSLFEKYEQSKSLKNQFDFDDMLLGCYELLVENKGLLEKYQERFSYILVDEFQDINKVQYEIISLLASQSKNLCVVGDDDQSIYGFRGSDPSYILNFERDFPGANVVTLKYNYRSQHSIVTSAKNLISANKERMQKDIHAVSNDPIYPVQFFPFDEEEEATMIVTDIKEKIEKGANPNEFAILYRTNSAARATFERLVASSLPFYMEQDGESFYSKRIIRKAIAYLELTINPDHQEAIKELLGTLFIKQGRLRDVKALSILHDCSLLEAMTKLTEVQPFQLKKIKKMLPLFNQLKTFSPVEALEWIEKEMGLGEFIKKNGNEGNAIDKGTDDLRDLKVAARSHEQISDFLSHVDHMIRMTTQLKSEKDNNNCIKLMTVHRAKGLEFNCVYLLSVVEGGFPHDFALEAFREGNKQPLEEERRLMYVALTRAKDHLYLSIPERRRGKKAHPSRFIREMS